MRCFVEEKEKRSCQTEPFAFGGTSMSFQPNYRDGIVNWPKCKERNFAVAPSV